MASALASFPAPRGGYAVAYSGGADSTALLRLLIALRPRRMRAIHICHHLHPDAESWARGCAARCRAWGVDFDIADVHIDPDDARGMEAAARAARYRQLEAMLGDDEMLLTAQHVHDQAETFLLQAVRGAGPKGLAAMPRVTAFGRGWLARPLLDVSGEALRDYLRREGVGWHRDPANEDTQIDRVYLRRQVWPTLERRWPGAAAGLGRAAAWCAEADGLLDELGRMDAHACVDEFGALTVSRAVELSSARVRNLLRVWLRTRKLPLPDHRRLLEIEHSLHAPHDSRAHVAWQSGEVRRYADRLFAMPPLPPPPEAFSEAWRGRPLALPPGCGCLDAVARQGAGIDPGAGPFTVAMRSGGERLRLPGRAHDTALKTVLQEAGVPPWVRERLPLILAGDEIAAVADYFVCAGYEAPAGESGWQLAWRDAPVGSALGYRHFGPSHG